MSPVLSRHAKDFRAAAAQLLHGQHAIDHPSRVWPRAMATPLAGTQLRDALSPTVLRIARAVRLLPLQARQIRAWSAGQARRGTGAARIHSRATSRRALFQGVSAFSAVPSEARRLRALQQPWIRMLVHLLAAVESRPTWTKS